MRARLAGLLLACVCGGAASAEPAPPVRAITWIISNTMAVPDAGQMRRPADELVQWLQAQLPEVAFQPVVANAERGWALLREGRQACHAGAARTPQREREAYFTDTWLVPPPQLIVRKDRRALLPTDGLGTVDLAAVLADRGLRGVLTRGRSYGPALDALLAARPAAARVQQVWSGDYGSNQLPMLIQGRADYTLDYPITLAALAGTQGAEVPLAALPVKGAGKALVSGIACPRTAWGLAAIRLIDATLGTPEGAALLRDTLRISLPPDTQRAYQDVLDAHFKRRARPTPGL